MFACVPAIVLEVKPDDFQASSQAQRGDEDEDGYEQSGEGNLAWCRLSGVPPTIEAGEHSKRIASPN